MKTNVYVEYSGSKKDIKALTDTVKEIWKEKGGKVKDLSNIDIYYKPEEGMCYYVINHTEEGSFCVQ